MDLIIAISRETYTCSYVWNIYTHVYVHMDKQMCDKYDQQNIYGAFR